MTKLLILLGCIVVAGVLVWRNTVARGRQRVVLACLLAPPVGAMLYYVGAIVLLFFNGQ